MYDRSREINSRDEADNFKKQGEAFFLDKKFDSAISQYQHAIDKLNKLEIQLNDDDYRFLSFCWNKMGEAYKFSGFNQREQAIQCFKNALATVHLIKSRQNESYSHIATIYHNLVSLTTVHSNEHKVYNLAVYIFSDTACSIPQLLENQLAELKTLPSWTVPIDIYASWIQLLELIRDLWKPEFFPAECQLRIYLSQEENMTMIQEKITEFQNNRRSLADILERSSGLISSMALDISAQRANTAVLEKIVERRSELISSMGLEISAMGANIAVLKKEVARLQIEIDLLKGENEALKNPMGSDSAVKEGKKAKGLSIFDLNLPDDTEFYPQRFGLD